MRGAFCQIRTAQLYEAYRKTNKEAPKEKKPSELLAILYNRKLCLGATRTSDSIKMNKRQIESRFFICVLLTLNKIDRSLTVFHIFSASKGVVMTSLCAINKS